MVDVAMKTLSMAVCEFGPNLVGNLTTQTSL